MTIYLLLSIYYQKIYSMLLNTNNDSEDAMGMKVMRRLHYPDIRNSAKQSHYRAP